MEAIEEMAQGYCDGSHPDSPEPSDNRSRSYRHGFANGRDDLARKPRATAQWLRAAAKAAMEALIFCVTMSYGVYCTNQNPMPLFPPDTSMPVVVSTMTPECPEGRPCSCYLTK